MDDINTTKQKLLQAACEIFSAKGYRDATVAEICDAAGANIAAVNYHFGDKSNLYYACFTHLIALANRTYPQPDPETAASEEWLCSFIHSRILNILDDGEAGLLPRLMYQEMGQPTDIHARLHEDFIEPMLMMIRSKILDYLGGEAGEGILNIALVNFTSLHVFMNVGMQQARDNNRLCQTQCCKDMDPDAVAAQAESFALGGLRATRDFLRTGGIAQ